METPIVIEEISNHLKSEHLQGEGLSKAEDQVFRLFERAGVAEEIAKLPKERLGLVTEGVVTLWKIDSMGKNVEQKDKEKICGSEKSPESVNENV